VRSGHASTNVEVIPVVVVPSSNEWMSAARDYVKEGRNSAPIIFVETLSAELPGGTIDQLGVAWGAPAVGGGTRTGGAKAIVARPAQLSIGRWPPLSSREA